MVKVEKMRLHVEVFGNQNNQACVLISGAMASARFWSDNFCEYIANHDYFVIRYDHRDIGESPAVDWKKHPYSLHDLAKDAIDILDIYKINKAHFVGHSMGGCVCQQLGIDYPKRCIDISIVSSGPIGATRDTDEPLTEGESRMLERTWKIFLEPKDESTLESHVKSFMSVWRYLNGDYFLNEKMAENYTRDLLTRTQHKIQVGNNHELLMKNLERSLNNNRDILKQIHIPTIVIHGEKDPIALLKYGKSIANAIKNAKLIVIPKMGHVFFNKKLEIKIANFLIENFRYRK